MNKPIYTDGRQCGAAFFGWIRLYSEHVRWLTKPHSFYGRASEEAQRGLCAARRALFSCVREKRPGETQLLIGVFDDPSAFAPRREVFIEDALTWALKPKDRP